MFNLVELPRLEFRCLDWSYWKCGKSLVFVYLIHQVDLRFATLGFFPRTLIDHETLGKTIIYLSANTD